jgi:N-acetylglucosaminyl-diphospho-decaprenol L-rhamnosyltransferase
VGSAGLRARASTGLGNRRRPARLQRVPRVGRWDERYFLYSEETDFLRRVRGAGMQVRFDPAAVVRHIGGGSGTSEGLYALCAINSVRYYRRYHARPATLAFAMMVALHQLLRARRPEARLALRALMFPTARASLPQPVPAAPAPPRPHD